MATLELGPTPDPLSLSYVTDDPWTSSLTLLDAAGVATAWPAAPVLEFDAGIVWTSALTELNTKATWARTVADIAALHTAIQTAGAGVRLSVNGVTQWKGQVVRRA